MEQTEEILEKTIYARGYYFTELSFFPTLNHCKNHYYFEMMTRDCDIVSNEWYIPRGWERGLLEGILEEKQSAAREAAALYEQLLTLEDRIEQVEYHKLWVKFCNLKLVTEVWVQLAKIFMDYVKYFENREEAYATALEKDIEEILRLNSLGTKLLGKQFYCLNSTDAFDSDANIESFVEEIRENFRLEKEAVDRIEKEQGVMDYVICGGAMEGHRLQKEVNFSDTLVRDTRLVCLKSRFVSEGLHAV